MKKVYLKRRCLWLIPLLLMMPVVTTLAQTLVNEYVTVDGIEYRIDSKYQAVANSLTNDFTGTSIVLADYVEGVWRNGNVEEKANVPVVRFNASLITDNITSLSLSKSYEGSLNSYGNTFRYNIDLYRSSLGYGRNLKEISVAAGNPYYSSRNGLLCNAAGDTLMYVPFSYAENETIIIPEGIQYINGDAYAQIYVNNRPQYISVKHIVFEGSVTNVSIPSYTNFTTAKFANNLPPQIYCNSNINTIVFYVPTGSADAYYNQYHPLAVIEDNSNIKSLTPNGFGFTSFYDANKDGHIDLVGNRTVNVSGTNKSLFQFVNEDVIVHSDTIVGALKSSNNNKLSIVQNPNSDKLQYVADGTIHEQTDENHCARIFNEDYSLYVDVDNDGLKDIVSKYRSSDELDIFMQQPDGSFVKSRQYLTEKVEEVEADGNLTLVTFLQGFLRNSMFVDDAPSPFENLTMTADFNNDGILDFADNVAGGIMYSYGDGKYLTSKGKEIVYPVDIDGDGVLDFVVFDGETIYLMKNVNSATSEKKELFKNSKIDKMFFKDFDHDGDIDILSFISSTTNNNISYFVFLRNNGDGTFRRKESSIAVEYTLVDCKDYDADGKYELLVIDQSYVDRNRKNDGVLLKVENNFTISTISETFGIPQSTSYQKGKNLILGDFDNDGFTEFYSNNGDLYGFLSSQTIQNTAPNKMEKPTALYDPATNRLKITWKRGQDQETSTCDLTYALRIGTAPGLDDIVRPASLPDGRRKTIREGEMGTALSTLFNAASLKPGKYYISVQAIDAGGLGGQFSDELEYEHQISAPKIYVSANELSTADTLEVYIKNTIPGASYEWITSEGEIRDKTDNGAKVVFYQSGVHELSLIMTLAGITYQSTPQDVNVLATKYSNLNSYIDPFMDINQDGLIDGYDYDGNITMYKNENGSYSTIQLSTFADLNGSIRLVTDFNHDGYPDFIIDDCSKGNVFLNYGEQDYDFDYQTKEIHIPQYIIWGIDLNNDGWPDFDSYGFCYSEPFLKDYNWTSFSDFTNTDTYDYAIDPQFIDVNRDGFMDIVWGADNQDETIVYCKLKDNTTDCAYGEPIVLFRLPYELRQYYTKIDNPDPEKYEYVYAGNSYNGVVFEDFNNDGYFDLGLAIQKFVNKHPWSGATEENNEFTFYIFKGKPEGESSEIVQKIDNVYKIGYNVYDINNDGYKDIPYFEMNASRKWNGWNDDYSGDQYTLLMKPDFGYEIMKYESPEGNEVIPMSTKGDICLIKEGSSLNFKTNILNQAPAAPASVTAKQTKDGMLITWSDAVDKETPAMQMRYNISVKRKGKTGDGAFIISPMNGLKNEAAIVPGYDYKKSTQMLIPSTVLTTGETYEIQVQAIDLWGAYSPMTPPVELTIGNKGYIDMVERVATGKETLVKYVGTQAASYSLQPGEGGTIVSDNGNGTYTVSWSSEGVKEVVINAGSTQVKSSITVIKPFDMTFNVPSYVLAGAPVAIKAPADMAEAVGKANWRCDDPKVTITYKSGDEYAYVLFPTAGTYKLEAYCTDSVRENSYQRTITIENAMPKATIKRVNTIESNYDIEWDATELPSYIDKVVVLREGKSLNQFTTLDEINAQQGHFVDQTSNSMVVSNRYGIMLVASNGQISEMSGIHKPLHVMLGYSAIGGYNLMWNDYEGLTVDNYQIWRGSSPETMELYEQVAGSQLNYTDLTPLAGDNYYSIVFTPQVAAAARPMNRAPLNDDNTVSSNWISSNQAVNLVLAESIEIVTGSNKELTKDCPMLSLYCIVNPAYSSISKVKWSIVEGENLATIDAEGHLTAKEGKGNVVVRATTIDGTNLSSEITIPCDVVYIYPGDINADGVVDVSDAVSMVNVIHQDLSDPITIALYDMNGDGEVDVFDVTQVISIILSNNSHNVAPRRLMGNFTENVYLTTNNNGLLMGIDNAERFTAFQFDIEVPEGTKLDGASLLNTGTNHSIQLAKTGDYSYRVIGLSMNNELLLSSSDKLINMRLSGNQEGNIFIRNIMFVNKNAEKIFFNDEEFVMETTGIRSVADEQSANGYYDLSGRKLGFERSQLGNGIYIVNGKKVVIK